MKILLIDDIGGPSLLDTIRCLGIQKNNTIFIFSPEKKKAPNTIPYSRYVQEYLSVICETEEELLIQIKQLVSKWEIDIVLPAKQSNYRFFSKYRQDFSPALLPPITDHEKFKTVSNKWLLFEWMDQRGFPTPKSYPALVSNLNELSFPLILKPRLDNAGTLVKSLHSMEEAKKALEDPNFIPENFILQEFVSGEDIDISILAVDGDIKAYTIQKGLVRGNLSFATGMEFVKDDRLLKQTEAIIQELKWSGIAHLDFIYDKNSDSYMLLDFNPRVWTTLLGSLHAGVNFPMLLLDLHQGKEVEYSGYENIQFYLTKQALLKFKKEWFKAKLSSLKNSSWHYISKDPMPEIVKGFGTLRSVFK